MRVHMGHDRARGTAPGPLPRPGVRGGRESVVSGLWGPRGFCVGPPHLIRAHKHTGQGEPRASHTPMEGSVTFYGKVLRAMQRRGLSNNGVIPAVRQVLG